MEDITDEPHLGVFRHSGPALATYVTHITSAIRHQNTLYQSEKGFVLYSQYLLQLKEESGSTPVAVNDLDLMKPVLSKWDFRFRTA